MISPEANSTDEHTVAIEHAREDILDNAQRRDLETVEPHIVRGRE